MAKLNAAGTALIYSTYLGGTAEDEGDSIAVDSAGNASVAGSTVSTDFPTTPGAFQSAYGGGNCGSAPPGLPPPTVPCPDAFVAKLNATGTALLYSTYLGGSGADRPFGIAVDSSGNAYLTGSTSSTNFPTASAFQAGYRGGNCPLGNFSNPCTVAFLSKLNPTGSALVYSTYLGGLGLDAGAAIAVDSSGNAYVSGQASSTDFPTASPLQAANGGGLSDAFVAKLNAAGSALVYSTYLGGNGDDTPLAIAVDSSGSAYVTGSTNSTNFPTVSPFQAGLSSAFGNAFIAKIVDRTAASPSLPPNSVVNAASFRPNSAIAPGSIVAMFGTDLAGATQGAGTVPLPTTLMDSTVAFNNILAPLFFVSPGQINAQISFEVPAGTASVAVKRGSGSSAPQSISVAVVSPGLFTTNSSGSGQGAILIAGTATVAAASGSLPGREARAVQRGVESISIYSTGLGDVTNRPALGAAAPANPLSETIAKPTATVGGVSATPGFSGLAPFFVGLYQVNVPVPANAPVGDAVAVVLTIGGVSSNIATIAVQ